MLSRPMAIWRGVQPVVVEQPAQNQEVEDTLVFSLRTTSRCLLFVEASLEGIHDMLNMVIQRLDALINVQSTKKMKESYGIGEDEEEEDFDNKTTKN